MLNEAEEKLSGQELHEARQLTKQLIHERAEMEKEKRALQEAAHSMRSKGIELQCEINDKTAKLKKVSLQIVSTDKDIEGHREEVIELKHFIKKSEEEKKRRAEEKKKLKAKLKRAATKKAHERTKSQQLEL